MNMITIDPNNWRFVVTMIAVCVPFFILIFILQTHTGMSLYRRVRQHIKGHRERRRQRAFARQEQRSQLQRTEMIRRQSCATTFVAEKRESVWKFDSAGGGTVSVAAGELPSRGGGESRRGWWARWRRGAEDSVGSTDDMNV